MGPLKKYVTVKITIFDPHPPCHHLSPVALTPSPLVITQIVTNFELIMGPSLMKVLDLIFSKICIFSTQFLLSTWKATLSRWNDVITTFKVIVMRLLKRYLFEVVTSLLGLIPSPLVTLCHYFAWSPSPLGQWHTFEWPLSDSLIILTSIIWTSIVQMPQNKSLEKSKD